MVGILFLPKVRGYNISNQEHWTYLQGINFALISVLGIDYDDFFPLHAVTRVLLFFFVLYVSA